VSEIEQRLRELQCELRDLSWRRRRRVLAEARDHLGCALDDGLSEADAVASLGAPGAAFEGFPGPRRPRRLVAVAAPMVLLALAPSLDGTLQRLGAGTAQSHAATPPTFTRSQADAIVRRCAAAWNGKTTGRWREAAVRAGIQRAYVSISLATTLAASGRKETTRLAGCTVILQTAFTASPFQTRILVYGKPAGRTFHFDRLLRGHSRTSVPATNARVDSAGRLTLTGHLLAAVCPRAPIGSGVVAVRALPEGLALPLNGTTRLRGTGSSTFVVEIRNAGRVAIQGAIASLEISGPARPGRTWWRSGPRIVPRLEPGASVSVRFTPPPLGHGVRLLRATTAAIVCESRTADNSPVFRVAFS
jgi:hypothetical protein